MWGSSLDNLFPVGRNTGRGVLGHGVGVVRVMVVAAGGWIPSRFRNFVEGGVGRCAAVNH